MFSMHMSWARSIAQQNNYSNSHNSPQIRSSSSRNSSRLNRWMRNCESRYMLCESEDIHKNNLWQAVEFYPIEFLLDNFSSTCCLRIPPTLNWKSRHSSLRWDISHTLHVHRGTSEFMTTSIVEKSFYILWIFSRCCSTINFHKLLHFFTPFVNNNFHI